MPFIAHLSLQPRSFDHMHLSDNTRIGLLNRQHYLFEGNYLQVKIPPAIQEGFFPKTTINKFLLSRYGVMIIRRVAIDVLVSN